MATLCRPGCCFSRERQKRFSQAMFSRGAVRGSRDSSSRKVSVVSPQIDVPAADGDDGLAAGLMMAI